MNIKYVNRNLLFLPEIYTQTLLHRGHNYYLSQKDVQI